MAPVMSACNASEHHDANRGTGADWLTMRAHASVSAVHSTNAFFVQFVKMTRVVKIDGAAQLLASSVWFFVVPCV